MLSLMAAPKLQAVTTEFVEQPHIRVRLFLPATSLVAGENNYLGLALIPDEHWHVYWRNPGDSGMPPRIRFEDAAGVAVGEPLWPTPAKIPFGPLTNYGYEHVVLPIPLQVEHAQLGNSVTLRAKASWLVCRELCVPGKSEFRLTLPVLKQSEPTADHALLQRAIENVPQPLALIGGSAHATEDAAITIELFSRTPVFRDAQAVQFFPINEQLVSASAEPDIRWKNNALRIRQRRSSDFYAMPARLEGVLVVDEQAWQFSMETQH